jgi:hypothetical protein
MPTIAVFFGIAVRMHFTDHPPPHFHVSYQRYRALIAIETGAIIYGSRQERIESYESGRRDTERS